MSVTLVLMHLVRRTPSDMPPVRETNDRNATSSSWRDRRFSSGKREVSLQKPAARRSPQVMALMMVDVGKPWFLYSTRHGVACPPETAGAEGTAATRRGALQRGRHLRSVNRDKRLHTDSGGHFTGIARTRQRRAAGSAIACFSTHAPSKTAAPTTDSAVDYGRRRATTDLTMSIRTWSDSATRKAITLQVAQQIHQGAEGRISAPLSAPRDIFHIGKIPIVYGPDIGIFPMSIPAQSANARNSRTWLLSRFLLARSDDRDVRR
jgi:hypothetical protein